MSEQAYRISSEREPSRDPNSLNAFDDSRMCYWKGELGWELYIPRCGAGLLKNHTVAEHDNGTITVTPSIKMWGHNQGKKIMRHGYLIRGAWNPCEDDLR
jgi:hypothetical protein